jgi:hypothetical protein
MIISQIIKKESNLLQMAIFVGLVITTQFIVIIQQHNRIKELHYRNDYVLKQHRKQKGLPE